MQDLNITIDEFLNLFYQNVKDTEIVLVAKPKKPKEGEDPTLTAYLHFEASPRALKMVKRQDNLAWYACISTLDNVQSLEKGYRTRQKIDCKTLHVVLIDDIGDPKKSSKKIPAQLTALLETSKDNYQGLVKIHPLDISSDEEREKCESYIKGMAAKGYGDEGAEGVNRVCRLPGSINIKENKGRFKTRVVEWNPDVIYGFYELMELLGVEPLYKNDKRPQTSTFTSADVPEEFEDVVFNWLLERNEVGKKSGGFYEIPCPQANLHTTRGLTAGYSPLGHGELPQARVFSCFHGHCKDIYTPSDFLAYVAKEGGPRVSVSGEGEMALDMLRKSTAALPTRDVQVSDQNRQGTRDKLKKLSKIRRYMLLRDVLKKECPISAHDLHDCKMGAKAPKGAQLTSMANVMCIIEKLDINARFNMQTHLPDLAFRKESTQEIVHAIDGQILEGDGAKSEPLEDSMVNSAIRHSVIDTALNLDMKSRSDIHLCINDIANFEKYHPADELMFYEKWDGESRIEALSNTITLDNEGDRPLFTKMLRMWLLQVPQAVYGFNAPLPIPFVLVLASPKHGTGKTTWFERLVTHPSLFKRAVTLSMSKGNVTDTIRQATGTLISELGELETTFSKSADGDLKNFLSNTRDEYRIPYSPNSVKYARSTVFCGTVNHVEFINEKGSRRFWPFLIKICDIYHKVDMAQVWAEVKHIYDTEQVPRTSGQDEIWAPSLKTNEVITQHVENFRNRSHVEELLDEHFNHFEQPGEPVNVSDICVKLDVGTDPRTRTAIKEYMYDKLGQTKNRMKDGSGKTRQKVWSWPLNPIDRTKGLKIIK